MATITIQIDSPTLTCSGQNCLTTSSYLPGYISVSGPYEQPVYIGGGFMLPSGWSAITLNNTSNVLCPICATAMTAQLKAPS